MKAKLAPFPVLACLLVTYHPSLVTASQIRGSGRVVACAGGMPYPCSATDRVPRSNVRTDYATNIDGTWSDNGPQVRQVFINDFGNREVRVTDGIVPTTSNYGGDGWSGPVGWWINYFSVYDPSIDGTGGYYFFVPLDNGLGNELFTLNAKTMQVGWQGLVSYAGGFSFLTPGLMYYATGAQVCSWNYDSGSGSGTCSDGHGTEIYDFSTCPSLSGISGLGDLVVSHDDQTFSERTSNILAVYSSRYAKCYWVNVSSNQIGGTDNPTPISVTVPGWPSGYGYHDGIINASGQYGWLVPNNGGTLVDFWTIFGGSGVETTTINECTATSGSCQGHISLGYSKAVYVESNPPNGGVSPHYDFGLLPMGAPTTQTHVLTGGPPWYNPFVNPNCNVTDTHTEWENVNVSDNTPFVESSFVDASNSPFSLMQIVCAWDHEIDAVSTDRSGVVWRLAHNRATGKNNPLAAIGSGYNADSMPVCSSDGKYCLWATDWQASLGTQTGEIGGGNYCQGPYGCEWQPGTAYALNQEVIDLNGNEEMTTMAGTSGSTQPVWPTTIGGTVTDGGVKWQMGAGCDTAQTRATAGVCRTDAFIVEVK